MLSGFALESGLQRFVRCVTVGGVVRPQGMCRRLRPFTALIDTATIPFAQRLTCTIAEPCEASGSSRTKLYELIGVGYLDSTRPAFCFDVPDRRRHAAR